MTSTFPGNRTTHKGMPNGALLLSGLASLCLLSACQPQSKVRTGPAAQAQRQQIYNQLVRLEASLGSEYPAEGLPVPDQTEREWVRNLPIMSAAQFENARVSRLKAFQELADLAAPEESAGDFAAFWEIHSAYRRAVDMARLGQGQIDLVYSRPYPLDPLNGPHLAAYDTLNKLAAATADADLSSMLAMQQIIADNLQTVRRRLDFDLAAEQIPPRDLLQRLAAEINASPYSSETAHAEWMRAWRAAVPQGQTRSDWAIELANQNTALVLPQMIALRDKLNSLLDVQAESLTALPSEMEFYHVLIRQITSGRGDGAACFSIAARQADETLAQFWDIVQTDWNAHIPVPPAPDGVEAYEPPALPVNTPDIPYDVLLEWSRRAPMFLTTVASQDLTNPTTQGFPEPDAVALPQSYLEFVAAYEKLAPMLAPLSTSVTPTLSFSPVIPAPLAPTGRNTPPPVSSLPPLFEAAGTSLSGDVSINLSVARLEASAPSADMMDLLKRYYPGHALRVKLMQRREDTPELARNLSTLAVDLGWPYFALEVLRTRRAFAESPQLEAAYLLDRLEMFAEAEAEAGFMTGELTKDDAIQTLINRLGISRSEAQTRLAEFRAEPGIACATLEGYTALDMLSERARSVLSTRFDIAAFNQELLSSGSRPLDIIELEIDDWVSTQLN